MKGHFIYSTNRRKENLTAQQNQYAFDAFKKLLDEIRPKRVLEIGTAGGGSIQFIRDYLDDIGLTNTTIKSFEIREHKCYRSLRNNRIEVIIENIFAKSYRELEKPELVEGYIKSEGQTLVLCDGGSKINEFKLLSQFLKTGDIIMAHDYVDTNENFLENYKDKIWNWREIGDEHIEETCKTYNLKSYMKDTFDNAVWVCKIRE